MSDEPREIWDSLTPAQQKALIEASQCAQVIMGAKTEYKRINYRAADVLTDKSLIKRSDRFMARARCITDLGRRVVEAGRE